MSLLFFEFSLIVVKFFYIVFYDYDVWIEDDLSFVKGEIFEVDFDDLKNDWWRVKFCDFGKLGFILSNYVVVYEILEVEE